MGDIPFIEGTQEKENIIFDLRSNNGGHLTWANNFFKKLGWYTGKIIILYDNSSASAAESFYFLAKCNPDYVYGRPNGEIYFTITDYDYGKDFIEGRGLLPDAWAVTPEEYIKTMQWYTGDEGLDQLY